MGKYIKVQKSKIMKSNEIKIQRVKNGFVVVTMEKGKYHNHVFQIYDMETTQSAEDTICEVLQFVAGFMADGYTENVLQAEYMALPDEYEDLSVAIREE